MGVKAKPNTKAEEAKGDSNLLKSHSEKKESEQARKPKAEFNTSYNKPRPYRAVL